MLTSTRRTLSRNIRALRLLRGWSQEQLAGRCGLHRTYVGAIERGERNIGLDNLERLAHALNTTPAAMLDDSARHPFYHQVREAAVAPYSARHVAAYSLQLATHSLSTAARC